MNDGKYRVECGDPGLDRERILALWERCGFTTGEAARARYDWLYLQNPQGRGRLYLLLRGDSGELVGALGAASRTFVRGPGEAPLRAAILVDFVVHPAHRSMFPALQLQRAAREHELRDVQMIYALPDVKATPVFRRLGSSAQLSSGSHVRVMRLGKYASRLSSHAPSLLVRGVCGMLDRVRLCLPWLICRAYGVRAQWQPDFPEALDAFWQRAGARDNIATGERNRQFLQWRFNPQRHEWLVLSVTNRSGRIDGYFVCRRERDNLQVFDLLLAERDAAVPLLALALAAWPLKVESVRVMFGGFRRMKRALWRAGFLLRDQRPCFLIQATGAGAAPLPKEWWLTRADEDV